MGVAAPPTFAQPTFADGVLPNGVPEGATGTNVVESGPKFFDPASGDYRPDKPAGSPLVDLAGSDAPRGGRLLNGQTQTAGGWDAGALESNGAALPVELTRFAAAVGDGAVRLAWTTASETGNAGFRVQRRVVNASTPEEQRDGAPTGGSWVLLSRVDGAGTTTVPQRYRFVDEDLPFGAKRLEYRLVQVDVGGATATAEPVVVERQAPDRLRLLTLFPNPARREATVRLTLPEQADPAEARLAVYDVLGRRVTTRPLDAEGGRRRAVRLDVTGWPSGSYFVRLRAADATRTERLTVVQ